eukprot:6250902-Pyramimonas_sp.AAC.1
MIQLYSCDGPTCVRPRCVGVMGGALYGAGPLGNFRTGRGGMGAPRLYWRPIGQGFDIEPATIIRRFQPHQIRGRPKQVRGGGLHWVDEALSWEI